ARPGPSLSISTSTDTPAQLASAVAHDCGASSSDSAAPSSALTANLCPLRARHGLRRARGGCCAVSDLPTVTIPSQLRLGDTDKLGHINNAAYASFAEVGRLAFLKSLGIEAPSLILARLAIDFRHQVLLGDECFITTRVVRVGNSSIVMRSEERRVG